MGVRFTLVNLLKMVLTSLVHFKLNYLIYSILVLQVFVDQAYATQENVNITLCGNGCQESFYSENQASVLQNKIKRSRLLKLYSQSSLPEEKEALRFELNSIQILIANQLNSKLPQNQKVAGDSGEAVITAGSLPIVIDIPISEGSLFDTKGAVTSVGSLSEIIEVPKNQESQIVEREIPSVMAMKVEVSETSAVKAVQAEVGETPSVMAMQIEVSETPAVKAMKAEVSETSAVKSVQTEVSEIPSQWDYCELKEVSKSIGIFEQLYLARAPENKFWEGEELLQRELTNVNAWFNKLKATIKSKTEVVSLSDADELFKQLNDGNGITVFESLRRLEKFLESERVNLILNYSEMQDIVADTLLQLHAIIENLDLAIKGEKSQEAALFDIATIMNSKHGFDNYQERIDFIMQVTLLDIVFRDNSVSGQDKNKQDINLLVAIDHIKYQMAKRNLKTVDELRKVLTEVKEFSTQSNNKINCMPESILVQKNDFDTGKSLDLGSSFFTTIMLSEPKGKVVSTPVLKPWTSYIEADCLSLNKWQTTHNFWCTSDSQVGCDRLSSGICRSTQ